MLVCGGLLVEENIASESESGMVRQVS